MYRIDGKKASSNEFSWEYEDEVVAKFEFEITKCVSDYMVLYQVKEDDMEQIDLYIREERDYEFSR